MNKSNLLEATEGSSNFESLNTGEKFFAISAHLHQTLNQI